MDDIVWRISHALHYSLHHLSGGRGALGQLYRLQRSLGCLSERLHLGCIEAEHVTDVCRILPLEAVVDLRRLERLAGVQSINRLKSIRLTVVVWAHKYRCTARYGELSSLSNDLKPLMLTVFSSMCTSA